MRTKHPYTWLPESTRVATLSWDDETAKWADTVRANNPVSMPWLDAIIENNP